MLCTPSEAKEALHNLSGGNLCTRVKENNIMLSGLHKAKGTHKQTTYKIFPYTTVTMYYTKHFLSTNDLS